MTNMVKQNRLKVLAGVSMAVAVIGAAMVIGLLAIPARGEATDDMPTPSPTPTASPEPTPESSPTEIPTPTPVLTATPDPTSAPTPAPAGVLAPRAWVQVTGTGSCLNARTFPALKTPDGADVPVSNCLPDGFTGRLSDADYSPTGQLPVEADGHRWWHMMSQGWVAEDWIVYFHEDAVPFPPRPGLADAGLIAFIRTDGVWIMNADGSNQRRLVVTDPAAESVSAVKWSPDGQTLVFSLSKWTKPFAEQNVTRIVDLAGNVVAEFAGIGEPVFSPDGTRIAGLRLEYDAQSTVSSLRPVVVDIASRVETVVAPYTSYSSPEWSPDGQSLAVICVSARYQMTRPDGGVEDVVQDCGGDGLRIVPAGGGEPRIVLGFDNTAFYTGPSWSPDGGTIAIYSDGLGAPCKGYALVDVANGGVRDCLALPDQGSLSFGCGGGGGYGASAWTPDSSTLVYHWQSLQGETGVAVVNLTTGNRTMIPAQGVWGVGLSPDGAHVVFSAWPGVWVADIDGTGVSLLAEGDRPAWQPVP